MLCYCTVVFCSHTKEPFVRFIQPCHRTVFLAMLHAREQKDDQPSYQVGAEQNLACRCEPQLVEILMDYFEAIQHQIWQ